MKISDFGFGTADCGFGKAYSTFQLAAGSRQLVVVKLGTKH